MPTKTTSAEQLLDPRWQKKRLEVLDYSNFSCEICGAKASIAYGSWGKVCSMGSSFIQNNEIINLTSNSLPY